MPSINLQTTWGNPAIGQHGQIANEEKYNGISRTVVGAAGLKFGQPAFRATGADHRATATSNANFLGVTVGNLAVQGAMTATDTYPENSTAAIMTEGVMYVRVSAAVTAGAAAYYVTASNSYTSVSTGNVAIPQGVFDTAGAAGSIVKLAIKHRSFPVAA